MQEKEDEVRMESIKVVDLFAVLSFFLLSLSFTLSLSQFLSKNFSSENLSFSFSLQIKMFSFS